MSGADPTDYANDLPIEAARAAHRGTSFTPEDRGDQMRREYAATLAADLAALSRYADTDEKRAILAGEFTRYRTGYRTRMIAWLGARSRVMSTMITGGSNFPTARNRKRGDVADKRCTELVDYRAAALVAIERKLRPELRPIMAGDDDATTRLRAKLAKLETLQGAMKRANAAIRAHAKAGADAQVAAIVALKAGIGEGQARDLLKPDFAGRIGFADYEIRKTGAEIRRLRGRLESVAAAKATPDTRTEGTEATIEESAVDNRIRLTFPSKPDAMIRKRLKEAGFRWAPTLDAWQAYVNHHTRAVARAIAGAPPTAIDAAATFVAGEAAP